VLAEFYVVDLYHEEYRFQMRKVGQRVSASFILLFGTWLPASAASLSMSDFSALVTRCAPSMPVTTLTAVAKTESGLNPTVLHDNTTGVTDIPSTQNVALLEAQDWISKGHSVDVGLMQINSRNLPALGMSIAEAFDPCDSLAAGAAILRAAYGGGNTPAEQQVAMLIALSRYNTGSPFAGIMNGYAHLVAKNSASALLPPIPSTGLHGAPYLSDAPPDWNVSASADYAAAHGAPWLIDFSTADNSPDSNQRKR
jgi:type IV secretion system protein VirB1